MQRKQSERVSKNRESMKKSRVLARSEMYRIGEKGGETGFMVEKNKKTVGVLFCN